MDRITSHKDLIVWQKSVALACEVYAATETLAMIAADRELLEDSPALLASIAEVGRVSTSARPPHRPERRT